jgi:hypothetical protein
MSRRNFSGKLESRFNPFDQSYLIEILEAVAIAWTRMEHPSRTEIEDRITYRLAGRLLNDPNFADLPYDVIAQCWLIDLNGKLLARYDLRFKHRYSQLDYFVFEAKRLHVTRPGGRFSTEYPTYAGSKGMMAFIKGQYCRGLPAGGMLSYIMDGKSDKAWNGLEKRIESRRKPLKLIKTSKLAKSVLSNAIINAMQGTYLGETEHDLITHHFRLFHLLLPVRNG